MRSVKPQPIWKAAAARVAAAITLALVLFALHPLLAQNSAEHWVGTWSTSEVGRPQTPPAVMPGPPPFMANQCPPAPPPAPAFVHFSNQTLRQIVHTSIGGSRVRVVLSNRYGTAPLAIGAAHLALRDKDSAIQPASGRPLTFSGKPTFTIPAGRRRVQRPGESDGACRWAISRSTCICRGPPTLRRRSRCTTLRSRPTTFRKRAITPGPPSCRFPRRLRAGSSCIEWKSQRPARSGAWSPLAIRLPTARGRRRTRTTAGPICSPGGCCLRPLRSGSAS